MTDTAARLTCRPVGCRRPADRVLRGRKQCREHAWLAGGVERAAVPGCHSPSRRLGMRDAEESRAAGGESQTPPLATRVSISARQAANSSNSGLWLLGMMIRNWRPGLRAACHLDGDQVVRCEDHIRRSLVRGRERPTREQGRRDALVTTHQCRNRLTERP